jgi:hypothetical protein
VNIAIQPWIRIFDQQNRLLELSLVDVLVGSHKRRTIHGSTPLERVALFRLILAFLYRTSQPETEAEAERILKVGQFDAKLIKSYLAVWRDRFHLLHEDYPFFQHAHPPTKLEARNVNRLFLNYSTGIKGTLHSHIHDGTKMKLTLAQAARAVVLAQNFLTAGGNSGRPGQMFRHTGPLRQTNFILEGRSLFETLWIHLFPKSLEQSLSPFFPEIVASSEDRPVWERDDPELPMRQQPQGPLDALTYPCRLIKLVPETNRKTINQVIISQSLWIKENIPLFDPTTAYRLVPNKEEQEIFKVYPLKIEQGFLKELGLFDPEEANLAFPVYNRWRRLVQGGYLNPSHTLFTATGVECDEQYAALTHRIYNYQLQFPAEILVDRERFALLKKLDHETQLWSRLGAQALAAGIKSLHPLRQKHFVLLPSLFQEELQHLIEYWQPMVIAGKDAPNWEQIVLKVLNQQASRLSFGARGVALNKFNHLRAWQRKVKQNIVGEGHD